MSGLIKTYSMNVSWFGVGMKRVSTPLYSGFSDIETRNPLLHEIVPTVPSVEFTYSLLQDGKVALLEY